MKHPKNPPAKGFIYFAQDEDRTQIKIGFSYKPRQRLYYLQPRNIGAECFGTIPGRKIHFIGLIYGTQRDEHALHIRFSHERIQGEWFRENGDVRSWIDSLDLLTLAQADPARIPPPFSKTVKWSDEIDPSSIPDDILKSERARRNAAKRAVHAGGRPKSTDRCPCGRFTRETAAKRGHACPAVAA